MGDKVLAVADIHGRADRLAAIVARHPDAAFVFIAGDITGFGNEGDARNVIEAASSDGKIRRVLAVAGNCDPPEVRKFLEREGYSVESRAVDLGFARVVGSGGGLYRGGHTSFERDEEELLVSLEKALGDSSAPGRVGQALVVVSHNPPFDSDADFRFGRHVGSRSFGSLMRDREPDLWLCGHIHESRCASMEGSCLVVNPGPAAYGNYALLEFVPAEKGRRVRAALSA